MSEAMAVALQGALAGAGVGLALFFVEYLLLNSAAAERAKRMARKPELSDADRKQLASVARMCLLLPLVFGFASWVFWG